MKHHVCGINTLKISAFQSQTLNLMPFPLCISHVCNIAQAGFLSLLMLLHKHKNINDISGLEHTQ